LEIFSSAKLLNHIVFGTGFAQASLAFLGCPLALNKRTIRALPSSLGLKAVTITLVGLTLRIEFCIGILLSTGTAISGWLRSVPNLAALPESNRL
jgi:hypothetical protein